MTHPAHTRLLTFTEADLPDLNEVVLGSLAYLESAECPKINTAHYERPLVVGSGNALQAGRFLFSGTRAIFGEESEAARLITEGAGDSLYIISASGAKHAIMLAEKGVAGGMPTYLITANPNAPARAIVGSENTFIFPHIREPYTYNVSTYLSMLFGMGSESPKEILSFIETNVAPSIPDLKNFSAFMLVVPNAYGPVRKMYETKFDELFGPHVLGRSYTADEMKHAKTVVTDKTQCVISFGAPSGFVTKATEFTISLPETCGPAALIAIGYYVIGCIQKANHPYYKDRIHEYVKETSQAFGQHIGVIVE
jgi:hypothetical protein